jgi:hypothetical protein
MGLFSIGTEAVVLTAGTVVDDAVFSPPNRLKARATTITTRSNPLMASAALTPAVAWTAGRGAVGSGP